MENFIKHIREVGTKYPALQSQLQDLYELTHYEIEDGGSYEGEIEAGYSAINDLVEEHLGG